MSKLIIGHTTDRTTSIWVRGSARWPVAFVDLFDSRDRRVGRSRVAPLDAEDFYTAVVRVRGLSANTSYRVKVSFGKTSDTPPEERIRDAYTTGSFRTFPAPGASRDFTFMLGSCNLHSLGFYERPDRAWTRISRVAAEVESKFMIHCGDQIYADIPFDPTRSLEHYRDKYLDAWEDCVPAKRVLTELPHYMVLDDHEVDNNWNSESGKGDDTALRNVALKTYWEFQHSHNPPDPSGEVRYWYTFNHGSTQFFVMDTRTERSPDEARMVSAAQLRALKRWLSRHANALKFVVTSVPFVGHVRNPKKDKWCDGVYANQRSEIVEFLHANSIGKLVFLTGDMHNSYHATMRIDPDGSNLVVHELMSSPINQVTPNTRVRRNFEPSKAWQTLNGLKVRSEITPDSFYGDHSNVMAVDVSGGTVRYRVFRTSRVESAAKDETFHP